LRDPVSKDLFPFFFSNAENSFKYQRDLRQAQLRIAYIILYHVGLRINEIRELTQQDIKDARKSYQFNIIHHKTSKSNIYVLSKKAVKDLNQLDNEFNIIFEKYKYKYLFGKNKPIINKSLIRIINQDLKYTSQLLELPYNIKSHSFRVNMITNLLKVTSVQNTANIIGHSDIRSTMIYNRYALSKNQIQDLLEIMETKTDKSISIKNNID
jgi:integrase